MKIDLKRIAEFYTDNLEKYGISSKSVGWPEEETQILRFEKLLYVIDYKTDPISVNDLGCGYGELFRYLITNKFNICKYIGYDISENMIVAAKNYLKNDSRVNFNLDNKINYFADFSVSSGIFNVKFEENDKVWNEYILEILNNLNQYSSKGFSFNLLSKYVDYKEPHLFYGDPLYYWSYCRNHFSRYVSLLHDYQLFECTIVVKK